MQILRHFMQIQLSQCKDRIAKLEAQSEDPQDKSRVRILEGKDPLPGDMHKKIEDLEIHLATKEEQLMEKLLLLEQVGGDNVIMISLLVIVIVFVLFVFFSYLPFMKL